jgi:2-C-methyl-D-erythritol 4-phosphate cytidylyltransferase
VTSVKSIAAILVSAGSGKRFGDESDSAKQYQLLNGSPVYTWGLKCLLEHPRITAVVLVVAEGLEAEKRLDIDKWITNGLDKLSVTTGGATRQASVFNGLKLLSQLDSPPDAVLIHDSARPFITATMVDDVIKCVEKEPACTVGTPVSDTVKRVDNSIIGETVDRTNLMAVQTPQAAWFSELLKAHQRAEADGWVTTDDAAIMEMAGYKVSVVLSTRWNIKITTKEDLRICEALALAINR